MDNECFLFHFLAGVNLESQGHRDKWKWSPQAVSEHDQSPALFLVLRNDAIGFNY